MKFISAVMLFAACASRHAASAARSDILVPDPEDVNPLASDTAPITSSNAVLSEAPHAASLRGGGGSHGVIGEEAGALIQLQDDSSIADKTGGLQEEDTTEGTCAGKWCTLYYQFEVKGADGYWRFEPNDDFYPSLQCRDRWGLGFSSKISYGFFNDRENKRYRAVGSHLYGKQERCYRHGYGKHRAEFCLFCCDLNNCSCGCTRDEGSNSTVGDSST
jgi:hypothetical protein